MSNTCGTFIRNLNYLSALHAGISFGTVEYCSGGVEGSIKTLDSDIFVFCFQHFHTEGVFLHTMFWI